MNCVRERKKEERKRRKKDDEAIAFVFLSVCLLALVAQKVAFFCATLVDEARPGRWQRQA